jgi:hypothetical protein
LEPANRDSLARTVLTFTLATILLGSVVAAWFFYARSANNTTAFQHLETMVGVIITPVLSLFSAAVGFYYGERRGKKSKPVLPAAPAPPRP